MSRLSFDPIIPLALWLPLVLATCVALIAYFLASKGRIGPRRRVVILAMMSLASGLPLLILLNPTWIEPVPPPAGKPRLTILVDRSASMATADQAGGLSRYADAIRIAKQAHDALQTPFEIRTRTFADSGAQTDLGQLDQTNPEGSSTDLASAIDESLDELPQGQAILLLSDGIHNASGGISRLRQTTEKAKAMAAPIFARTVGGATSAKDIEVSLDLPQEMAFVGQKVATRVTVRQRGTVTDRVTLSLMLNDQVLDTQQILLRPDGTSEAVFQVSQPTSGLYRFEFRVDEHPNEVAVVNNVASLLLRVVDEPVKILLLEGKPYWDTKFLVRTLASDHSIELTSIVCMTPERFLQREISRPQLTTESNRPTAVDSNAAVDPELETREEAWKVISDARNTLSDPNVLSAYQIIVLGRDAEVYLDDNVLAQWKKWITEGNGSLVCFRGAPAAQVNQRLGEMLPVKWTPQRESRFRVKLTESGQSLHWLPADAGDDALTNLPSLARVTQPDRTKPLAVILAAVAGTSEQPDPVISYQPFGNGRVVMVEGTGMWRWAFLPPEHQNHDPTYGVLWRSLVRWLVANAGLLPSQQWAMRSDKTIFSTNETPTATLLLRDSVTPPEIELSGAALQQPRRFVPTPAGEATGQFRVAFGKLEEGRYRAKIMNADENDSAAIAPFDVRGSLEERLDLVARPDVMALIARQSGGTVLEGGSPAEISKQFTNHLATRLPQRTTRILAWDRWWILSFLFFQWGLAWGIRRATGLV